MSSEKKLKLSIRPPRQATSKPMLHSSGSSNSLPMPWFALVRSAPFSNVQVAGLAVWIQPSKPVGPLKMRTGRGAMTTSLTITRRKLRRPAYQVSSVTVSSVTAAIWPRTLSPFISVRVASWVPLKSGRVAGRVTSNTFFNQNGVGFSRMGEFQTMRSAVTAPRDPESWSMVGLAKRMTEACSSAAAAASERVKMTSERRWVMARRPPWIPWILWVAWPPRPPWVWPAPARRR